MRKITNLIIVAALSTLICSCAKRVKVLDANAVSVTDYNLKRGTKLKEYRETESKFCPNTFKDGGTLGLIDEAVKNFQKTTGADFITHAVFYREGNCMVVEGTPAKVVSSKKRRRKRRSKSRRYRR